MKIAIDVLTDVATQFSSDRFFFDKENIGVDMQTALNATFGTMCHLSVEYFQLRNIDLPDHYETAIQQTEVKKQDINKAYAERNRTVIELQTSVKQAQIAANITINNALGQAESMIQKNEAEVQTFYNIQKQQADAFAALKTQLGLNSTELIQYIKAKLLKEYNPSKLVIGMDVAA